MSKKMTDCYNCKSDSYTDYDEENGFTYVKCNNCGLVYLNPQPSLEEINSAHKMGMHKGESTINVTGRYRLRMLGMYGKVLDHFFSPDELEEKKWLDVGCGFGEFIESLNIFSHKKLKVRGSEPNQFKIDSCVSRNLDVSFIELSDISQKYDFISLLNVYSHLPDPIEFISQLKELLNDKGEILLQTGHSSHLDAKDHHKPYYAPDHISFANREIVEDILERCGFEIVQTEIYRCEQFPTIKKPKTIVLEAAKILLNKNGRMSNFFPVSPNRDMYIRARLR